MQNEIQKIIRKNSNQKLIENSFEFAKKAYKDKNRISGENYLQHALRVANILNDMNLDSTTISFALLHDVLDDLPESIRLAEIREIKKIFGEEVADLIQKISNLSVIRHPLKSIVAEKFKFSKTKTENLKKMFMAIAGDLRVVLVELISRLDGLNQLDVLPEDKKKLYAFETLQIFAPISSRLGLNEIRRKLEDISFLYLFPEKYKWLRENIQEEYEEREKYLKKFIQKLYKIFKKERVDIIEINYRTKSYWSTYKKLFNKEMDFKKIHDLLALRIIVKNIPDCYKTLGIMHKYFKPISEEINDYIAKPKPSGYRSLHTTIFSNQDTITELQIKTEDMHKEAEFGVCAHWAYKEKIDLNKNSKNLEWSQNSTDFWKSFKINFFENQVFALTPKGDIITLKSGSTPIDFAYAIHSEIGNHCESAKINGKISTIYEPLKNGDIVEIITNKKRAPSQDWLRVIKTNLAESQIKKTLASKEIVSKFPIGSFIKKKIIEITQIAKKKQVQRQQIKKDGPRNIYLAGQRGMLVNIAKCCKPEPGDNVQAYLTKYRSAVLHKTSCKNFQKLAKKFPEKIIDADWK